MSGFGREVDVEVGVLCLCRLPGPRVAREGKGKQP